MASEWITPNEGWDDNAAPVGADLNRIEGNTDVLHTMALNEATARLNADNAETLARQNADSAESTARQNADAAILSGNATFYIENRTSDPASPPVGHMWLRIDI